MLLEAAAQEVAQSETVLYISLVHETLDARPRSAVPTSATENLVLVAYLEAPSKAGVASVDGPSELDSQSPLSLVVRTLLELPLPFAKAAWAAAALTA